MAAGTAGGVAGHRFFQPPTKPKHITVADPGVVVKVYPLQLVKGREEVMGQGVQGVMGQVKLLQVFQVIEGITLNDRHLWVHEPELAERL